MDGKPTGSGLTTALYAVLTFGLVPTSMFFEVVEPVLGHGVLAQACYWTTAVVGITGLGRRCFTG